MMTATSIIVDVSFFFPDKKIFYHAIRKLFAGFFKYLDTGFRTPVKQVIIGLKWRVGQCQTMLGVM
jgi:hypothetical protein